VNHSIRRQLLVHFEFGLGRLTKSHWRQHERVKELQSREAVAPSGQMSRFRNIPLAHLVRR